MGIWYMPGRGQQTAWDDVSWKDFLHPSLPHLPKGNMHGPSYKEEAAVSGVRWVRSKNTMGETPPEEGAMPSQS